MTIKEILEKKKMSIYRLSKSSGVPYTTVNDICNKNIDLKKCSAETVYKLSKALDVTMEDLLNDYIEERISFELFKSNVCHELKEKGDVDFIIDTLEGHEIQYFFEKKRYPESFYLLAMLDYLSRENNIPICSDYDEIREYKLDKPIYPSGVLALCAAAKNEKAKEKAEKECIPEFKKYNIIESDIRNVI